MAYRGEISDRAAADMDETFVWLARQSTEAARKWFAAVEQAIRSLESLPARCPVAPEAERMASDARHLLFGRPPNVHRILFEIDEDIVRVARVRHGARSAE